MNTNTIKRYFNAAIVAALIFFLLTASGMAAKADVPAWVEYLYSDVTESDNPVNVFYVHCDDDYWVSLEIAYGDGAQQVTTGDYCNKKIHLLGAIDSVVVQGVIDAPVVFNVYLPEVMR